MDKNLLLNIQNFRKLTNLSLKECKDILTKNDLNFKKALDYYSNEYRISLSGLSDNIKVCENGMTFSYVHHNYKLGVILNVMCNTDFVSKNELFYELIKNLSIHIASTSPLFLNLYSINCDLLLKKRRYFFNEACRTARSKKDLTSIFQSYLHSWLNEFCLINQNYIKNSETSIDKLIVSYINKFKEYIYIQKFVIYRI